MLARILTTRRIAESTPSESSIKAGLTRIPTCGSIHSKCGRTATVCSSGFTSPATAPTAEPPWTWSWPTCSRSIWKGIPAGLRNTSTEPRRSKPWGCGGSRCVLHLVAQPGRLERLLLGGVHAQPPNQSAGDLPDVGEAPLERDTTERALASQDDDRHDLVARRQQLLEFHARGLERVRRECQEPDDPIASLVARAVDDSVVLNRDGRVCQLEDRVGIAAVEGVVHRAHDLDVVFAHRAVQYRARARGGPPARK